MLLRPREIEVTIDCTVSYGGVGAILMACLLLIAASMNRSAFAFPISLVFTFMFAGCGDPDVPTAGEGATGSLTTAAPTGLEVHPTGTTGAAPIALTWNASPGATSYTILRSTTAGAEVAYATSATNSFRDTAVIAGPPRVYFYKVAAVDANGTSAPSEEEETPTPMPVSTGKGDVAGTASGSASVYFCKDGLRGGFKWFETLTGWFPSVLGSTGAKSPGHVAVDMAYADKGTLTFTNVTVPSAGLYTLDWRYAFAHGLFKLVRNRHMGLSVNGVVVTTTQRFLITDDFEAYQHSALEVQLRAGRNTVVLFNVTDHGISRVDELTVTPAAAARPAGPTNLVATPGAAQIALSWTPSAGATQYQIYRGTTVSDGEADAPIATTGTASFVDRALTAGTTYFYRVSASNNVGVSPDSNEVTVRFGP